MEDEDESQWMCAMPEDVAENGEGRESGEHGDGGGIPAFITMAPDVGDVGMPFLEHSLEGGMEELPGGASGVGALGVVTGPLGIMAGVHELNEGIEHGDTVKEIQGGLGTLAGTASTSEGVLTIAAAGLGDGAAGATVGGVASAAGTVAPVAAAGALGVAAGAGMASAADSQYTRTGFWGQDESGQNRSAMDWGSNWGTAYDKWAGNTGPSVMGGIAAGAGGIVGGIAGAGHAAWNWLTEAE